MKKVVAGLVFVVGMGQAHALHCTLDKENPKQQGTFDQTVFNAIEVLKGGAKNQVILVKPDNSIVENFDSRSVDTIEKWQAIDKSIMAVITRNDDNTLAIGTASVDMTKKDNILPMDALAIGTEGKLLSVVNFAKKLSLSCFTF
jgi:hypothetical protein